MPDVAAGAKIFKAKCAQCHSTVSGFSFMFFVTNLNFCRFFSPRPQAGTQLERCRRTPVWPSWGLCLHPCQQEFWCFYFFFDLTLCESNRTRRLFLSNFPKALHGLRTIWWRTSRTPRNSSLVVCYVLSCQPNSFGNDRYQDGVCRYQEEEWACWLGCLFGLWNQLIPPFLHFPFSFLHFSWMLWIKDFSKFRQIIIFIFCCNKLINFN